MAQFIGVTLMFWSVILMNNGEVIVHSQGWMLIAFGIIALIVCVGATNIINFMDGINGITAGYALAVLIPLLLLNRDLSFIEDSYLLVSVLVFSFFNFRPKGKEKIFAGDVGSIGIAFIMLFAICLLMLSTKDITWLVFLIVYGIDGCQTILHRIILHEPLGRAHHKHVYQLMANELGMNHVVVSLIYMGLQLVISLVMEYVIPNTVLAHWVYLITAALMLTVAYVVFMKKYYYLHDNYLSSLNE